MSLAVDTENPLSSAITRSLKVTVPPNASGKVGFSNSGYWGIPVNEANYTNSFYIKGDYNGDVTLRLAGASSGSLYASQTISVKSNSSSYTYVETQYPVKQAPDGNNIWELTFDASKVAGKSLNFDLIQLYPPTFHDRCDCLYSSRIVSLMLTYFIDLMASNRKLQMFWLT